MFKEAPSPRIQLNKRPIKQLRLSISHFQVRRVPYLPNRGSAPEINFLLLSVIMRKSTLVTQSLYYVKPPLG